MPIASRLTSTGSLLVNGSFDENTQSAISTRANLVLASGFDELSLPTGAISFNGTTQYLTLANNSSIQLDASDFTIELWVYYSSFSNSPQLLQTATSNTANLSYSIATTTGGAIRYYLSSNGSSWNVASAISVGTAQLNSWNHVALVRNGTTVTPYLNGVAGTTTTTSATLFAFISALNIGSIGFNLTNNLNGYISNLRLIKGLAVYTGAFTPPQAILPATADVDASLLLHFNGLNTSTTFTDSSSNALSVTAGGGAQLSTAQFQFGNASVVFDGAGDSLQLPSSSALDFGTAPFTIEFFMRTDGTQDAFSIIISRTANAPSTGGIQSFGFANYGGIIAASVNDVNIVTASSATANNGSWHHIAISRSGTNMWLGVDGTIVSSNSSMTGSESVTLSSGRIGRWQGNNAGDNNYNGYLDEFRVTKGLALYTTTYTVPTAELPATADVDASLLLNVTDSANFIKDNSTNKFTLTNNGTATFIANGPFNQGSTATAQRQLPDGTLEVYNQFDEFTGAPIVDTSLMVWVDAGQTASYPGSGATWTDLSGNGKNYTLTNTPTYSSTTNGGVITFAGASSQYATTATTLFNSTTFNTYTMNLWVYPTGAGNFVQVNGQTTPNSAYHYSAIEISAGGTIKLGQWTGASVTVIATSIQSLNAWYNLVITYNGTTATAYVNGVSVGSTNIGWSSPGANTFMALMAIDATNMGTGAYASGSLGAFMVYNRGLIADEISTNFNALRGRYGI